MRGTTVAEPGSGGEADALVLGGRDGPGAVTAADCALVLISAPGAVALVHAGWQGAARGLLEAALGVLARRGAPAQAWLGPCLGPTSFEVGPEVADLFPRRFHAETSWGTRSVDLPGFLCDRLAAAGVDAAWCGIDTFTDPAFFSHRRGDLWRHALVAEVEE